MISIDQIFSIQTIITSLSTGVMVYLIRTFAESEKPSLADSKKWTGIFLPSLSVAIAVCIVLLSGLLPTFLLGAKLVDKISYGFIVGWCSGYIFSATKAILVKSSAE